MDIWRDIRLQARRQREDVENGTPIVGTSELLVATRKKTGLQLDRFAPGTVYGEGVVGSLERDDGLVRVVSGHHFGGPARTGVNSIPMSLLFNIFQGAFGF